MTNSSDPPARREPDKEPESVLDKARRAGALGSYLTIGVLLWLLFDARSENRVLREKLWDSKCPAPAATAPKPCESDTATVLRLLELAALHWPDTGPATNREPHGSQRANCPEAVRPKGTSACCNTEKLSAATVAKQGTD